MKKIFYTIGIALTLASCQQAGYEPWADPQSNPQEAGQTVELTVAEASAIDYATLTTDSVQLFIPTVASSEVSTDNYIAQITNGDNTVALNADANGYVAALELKEAVENLYGKRPEQRTLNMDITGYSLIGTQSIKNTTTATAKVTLAAPHIDAGGYYLVGDMFNTYKENGDVDVSGWSKDGALQLNHVGSGDVYDNPEWTVIVNIKANEFKKNDYYWKLIPATNYNGDFWAEGTTGVVGTVNNGETASEGNLTTTSPQAGLIAEPGIYRFTINMMNYSYKIEKLNFGEFFYEIGNESSWGTSHALYGPDFDGKYEGFYYLNGEFKFKPNADNWENDYEYDGEGKIADNGGSNCPAPDPAGFYQIKVDLSAGTYSLTQVTSISAIGEFNSWGGDVDLTYNKDKNCWTGTLVTEKAGGLKFRMNHDWSISWGGADGNGENFNSLTTNNGANLNVAAGTYDVELYISYNGASRVVLTKK